MGDGLRKSDSPIFVRFHDSLVYNLLQLLILYRHFDQCESPTRRLDNEAHLQVVPNHLLQY